MSIEYSVIIPTYNGSKRIESAVFSLLRQSIEPQKYEIIIVNDASTDRIEERVIELKRQYPDRNIVYLEHKINRGPAAARNTGIKTARGRILFFTDDDCEVPALWMELMLSIYKRYPFVSAVGGWYRPYMLQVQQNIYHYFIYTFYRFLFGDSLDFFIGENTNFPIFSRFPASNTANMSVKKWCIQQSGMFNETFKKPGSEDSELSERLRSLGFVMFYLPTDIYHQKELGILSFIRLAKNRAVGRKTYTAITQQRIGFYTDPTFLTLWTSYMRYYNYSTSQIFKKVKRRNKFLIGLISFTYLFFVYSKFSRKFLTN